MRALETFKTVDLIICENPLHTIKLLNHYNIKKPMDKLFEHNEKEKSACILNQLKSGQNIALVSDAGTPLISDPGYRLVSLLQTHDIQVVPIVGPCAAIAALSVCGLPTDHFVFEGFLPAKSSARRQQLAAVSQEKRTLVYYETPHRINGCLRDCIHVFGLMRMAALARELTKQYETVKRMPLGQLYQWLESTHQDRGEMVLIIQGAENVNHQHELFPLIEVLIPHIQGRQLVEVIRQHTGCAKQSIYQAIRDYEAKNE